MLLREITKHLNEGDVIDAKDRFGGQPSSLKFPMYRIMRRVTMIRTTETGWVQIFRSKDLALLKNKLQRIITPVKNGVEGVEPVSPDDLKVTKDGVNIAVPEFKIQEGTRCWKGYKKKGTKKMFGKTVPNCVKNEGEIVEGEERSIIHDAMVEYIVTHFNGYEDNYETKDELEFSMGQLVDHATLKDLGLDKTVVGGQPIENFTQSPKEVLSKNDVISDAKQQLNISHIKEQVPPLKKSNSPYKQAVDMWLRSKAGAGKTEEDFKDLSRLRQNIYLDKFKVRETIEASQDLNALMQGIDHDLANREKEIEENLRAWFGKGKKGGAGGGGWDRYNTKGERIGKCGDATKGEGKPKCLSKSKAASLRSSGGKSAIGKAVSKKRRNDPNKNRKGKAKNVSNTVGKKK